jgi:hypothetical protein
MRQRGQVVPSRGRDLGARAFVIVWDNQRNPVSSKLGNRGAPYYGSRFLSLQEFTWASLLGGNWPERAAKRGPADVLKAEREAVKSVLRRDGRIPMSMAVVEENEDGSERIEIRPMKVLRGPRRPHGRAPK